MIELVPMTEDEYQAVAAEMERVYADSLSKSGLKSVEEAEELAHKTTKSLLPDGLMTPNCYFFSIREAADKPPLGQIVLSVRPSVSRTVGQIWYITVNEEHRRQGIGTKALMALEDKCRAIGVQQLDLQVFGFNEAAIALYSKAGYKAATLIMSKDI